MKQKNKFIKAAAVSLIVGTGVIYNMDVSFEQTNENIVSAEQIEENIREKASEGNIISSLIIYSTSIISTSIKQLITNH